MHGTRTRSEVRRGDFFRFAPRERACADPQPVSSEVVPTANATRLDRGSRLRVEAQLSSGSSSPTLVVGLSRRSEQNPRPISRPIRTASLDVPVRTDRLDPTGCRMMPVDHVGLSRALPPHRTQRSPTKERGDASRSGARCLALCEPPVARRLCCMELLAFMPALSHKPSPQRRDQITWATQKGPVRPIADPCHENRWLRASRRSAPSDTVPSV